MVGQGACPQPLLSSLSPIFGVCRAELVFSRPWKSWARYAGHRERRVEGIAGIGRRLVAAAAGRRAAGPFRVQPGCRVSNRNCLASLRKRLGRAVPRSVRRRKPFFSFLPSRVTAIPANVTAAAHPQRDPARQSRENWDGKLIDNRHSFKLILPAFANTLAVRDRKATRFESRLFFTTHGGVGGVPGHARFDPVGNVLGGSPRDRAGADEAFQWMLGQARLARVPV